MQAAPEHEDADKQIDPSRTASDSRVAQYGARYVPSGQLGAWWIASIGAIAIAAGRTGIYPFDSPGGWQLIATAVEFEPFEPSRGPRLALGDRVRFEPA